MTDNDNTHTAETAKEEQTTPEVKENGGGDGTSVGANVKTPSKEGVTGAGDSKVKEKGDGLSDGDEEENEQTPQKVSLFEGPVVIEGKRDRKKTARLTEDIDKELKTQQEKKDKKCAIPEGKGTKLGDIPYVNHVISHKLQSDDLNLLHRLFFNHVGVASVRRGNIRKFCGFDFEEGTSEYEKKMDFLTRVFNKDMKKYILYPLGLKGEKTKEETAKVVLDYVMKPVDRNLKPQLAKKKKKSQKRKKASKKSEKTPKKKEGENEHVEDDSDSESDDEGAADSDDEEEPPIKKVKKSTPKKIPNKTPKKTETPKKAKKKGEKETKKKTPQKKTAEKPKKKTTPKKESKKPEDLSSLSSDSDDSDDEPLAKKVKKTAPPTDDEIKDAVKRILDSSDLEDLSIRKVFLQVSSMYPDFDMSEKQKFIKKTVKELIN